LGAENRVPDARPLKRKKRGTAPTLGERAKKIPTDKSRDFMNGGGAVLKKAKANSLSKVRAIRGDRCCSPWRKNGCPPHLRWSFRPFEVPGSSKTLGAKLRI
jgi:hypothetical protein